MRFDDRLATALGQPAESGPARQAVWRQLADLLGQAGSFESPMRGEALQRLRLWRSEVPVASRQHAAILLGGRKLPPDLVALFAEDSTIVAAPFLAVAEMGGEDWAGLIPQLSPVARALLRHRRDLPKKARRALDLFAAGDLVLDAPASVPVASGMEADQAARVRVPLAEFAFEADADGLVRWTDLASRGALYGLSLAQPAAVDTSGVDGHVVGAFRRRAPFRDARLLLKGEGEAAGDWSISGVPVFDPPTGRFTGYRGTARRPRMGERAEPSGLLGSSLTGDALRQLAHEVRTPLNAIAGFAEMIEQQLLGPAAAGYRARAASILAEAKRIQQVLDDLDEAAQAIGHGVGTPEPIDCAQLIARITAELAPLAARHGVLVALAIAPRCEPALLDPVAARRMTTRLLSAVIALGGDGERVDIKVTPPDGTDPETWIAVSRPARLADHDEDRLLDAASGEDDSAASPLGLGFTLRLVRSIAEGCGGGLSFTPECLRLRLPSVQSGHGLGHERTAAHAELARREAAPLSPPGRAGPVAQR